MVLRRGLGRGSGKKGYYNLIPHDRPVHQMSAKGMKQPQKLRPSLYGWKDVAPFKSGKTDTSSPMKVRELRLAYLQAVERKAPTFTLRGKVFVTNYAKYMLEYLKMRRLTDKDELVLTDGSGKFRSTIEYVEQDAVAYHHYNKPFDELTDSQQDEVLLEIQAIKHSKAIHENIKVMGKKIPIAEFNVKYKNGDDVFVDGKPARVSGDYDTFKSQYIWVDYGDGKRDIVPIEKVRTMRSMSGKSPQNGIPNLTLPTKDANRWPVQVGIIVPSTADNNTKTLTKAEHEQRIVKEEEWFTQNFGGDTSIMTAGRIRQKGQIVVEDGSWVFSSMPHEMYETSRKKIVNHVLEKQKEWGQDNILLKVEGVDFIIPKNQKLPDDKKLKSIPVG